MPVAMVIRELSNFGEFFVGFVEESPVELANWDVGGWLCLHCRFGLVWCRFGGGGGGGGLEV